ncbi:hypothetical protein C5167_038006 [Papaver somniferum]|uniref:Uncharacterized protein n=1 Tax=Papaver somniferum TaxID=3469 RepID=A0A4Y7IB65_PAPSO|nr:GDSL esterase/lipase At5g55050-like [Papaver somniferum]RZC45050.1 hypothetical protein C5167_038006 [Papaver somniferum]
MVDIWLVPSYLLLLLFSFSMGTMKLTQASTVSSIFIFGDSTADVGTNNNLEVAFVARANYPHNGIDFSSYGLPTGRFSNGRNTADYLAKLIGLRRSPAPFHALLGSEGSLNRHVIRGANFASGGSGILSLTGSQFGKVVPFDVQIIQFATVRGNFTEYSGSSRKTDTYLSKSLFFISVGSNDIFEYIHSNKNPNKEKFLTGLISTYQSQLRDLYKLGARKFGIVSTPLIGCCPSQRSLNATGGCLEILNEYSLAFYSMMGKMLVDLSCELKEMKYSFANAYEMVANIMDNPIPYGFKNITSACCGGGRFNGDSPCIETAEVCQNRSEYLFWDWYHPTQAASDLAAVTLYDEPPRFVTPINVRQLAKH